MPASARRRRSIWISRRWRIVTISTSIPMKWANSAWTDIASTRRWPFTPAAGLVMGTRSGDVDPGLASFLVRSEQRTASQFDRRMNHESGLLGVSETSSGMRELLSHETADVRAAEAVALFCYQTKKWIGAYAAALGGLDTLVFAGGIGENAPIVRARICEGLSFLGMRLDESRNTETAAVISADDSRATVRVSALTKN